MQAPVIGLLGTDRMRGCLAILRSPGMGVSAVQSRPKVKPVGGASATGVFPLGLRGEPILETFGQVPLPPFLRGHFHAVIAGSNEGHFLNGMIAQAREVARIESHHRLKFSLSDLVFPDPKIPSQRHRKPDALKGSRGDADHVGQRHRHRYRSRGGGWGRIIATANTRPQQRDQTGRDQKIYKTLHGAGV